jgi:hypothetical protein
MPDFTESPAGRAQDTEGSTKVLGAVTQRVLKTLLLPMLPLLSLQRNTLPIIRAGLQRDTDDYIKTIDKFALLELHALMMILDPERKLRGRFHENIEKDLAAELAQIFEKLSASLINVIEIQEIILSRIIDVLKEVKNEKHGNNGRSILPRLSHLLTGTLNGRSGINIEVILSRLEEILSEAKKGNNGQNLEAILSRLADVLNPTKNVNNSVVQVGMSRLMETLRGKVILSRLQDILSEAKKGNNGNNLEAVLSRLADVLNPTKNVNNSGAAQIGISRLVETLRGKVILSRLMDMLKQLKSGSDAKQKNDHK